MQPNAMATYKRLTTTLLLAALLSVFSHRSLAATAKFDPELKAKLAQAVSKSTSFTDKFDAQFWLLQKSSSLERFIKDPKERLDLLQLIHHQATLSDVPPEFVLAVIEIESGFNQFALSYVGAQGLMQVMPFWKNELGRKEDNLMEVKTNLKYGCTILKHYYDRAKGNWTEALARYNGSYGKLKYPIKVMNAWEKHWR